MATALSLSCLRVQDVRTRCLLDSDGQVVYPLSPCLASLIAPHTHVNGTPHDETKFDRDALNQAIIASSIEWETEAVAHLKLSAHIALTTSSDLDISHVQTLDYIHQHSPGLPIPRTLGIINSPSRTYHFIANTAGRTLESLWKQLSTDQKHSVTKQLDEVIRALRSIPAPQSVVGSAMKPFGGGDPPRCKHVRGGSIVHVSDRLITDEPQFNAFLTTSPSHPQSNRMRLVHSLMREDHACVMSHGELRPRNILVQISYDDKELSENCIQLTAITNWHKCGWYPEYWEYVKALGRGKRRNVHDWYRFLPPSIGVWLPEYSLDQQIDICHYQMR